MPLVSVYDDPAGINKQSKFVLDDGAKLMDWLISEYGPDGFSVPTKLFKNGHISEDNEIVLADHEDGLKLYGHDHIVIVHCPQEAGTIGLVISIISAVAAIVLAPNIPTPHTPGRSSDSADESPNNRLTGQVNVARPLQRIPDIYGRNKVWPDLIIKSYFEFIDNRKFVSEYLCIGRGSFLVEDIKSGDTLISDINFGSAIIYEPDTAPAIILDVTESSVVDGQELFAPDDTSVLSFSAIGDFSASTPTKITDTLPDFTAMTAGDQFTIAGSGLNDGTYTFQSAVITSPPFSQLKAEVTVLESTFVTEVAATFVVESLATESSTSGPFPVSGGTDEVWFDILCPQGVADRRTGTSVVITIEFDLRLERLDAPGGAVIGTENTRVGITGSTISEQFRTFKIIPDVPSDPYQASIERISSTATDANFLDQTKWSRLAGVADISGIDFGDVTTVLVQTKATEQATRAQERKFNAVVTRKLRTYNTGTGLIVPSLTASTKFADAALEHLTNTQLGNKPTTEIDLDQLYDIQDSLASVTNYGDALGRFSYSFSDGKVSVGDELVTILNAARSFAYREGNTFRFGREETKPFRTTLLNGRVKAPNSEKKTRRLQKPLDFDGIELQWTPEDENEGRTIVFPESGGSPINPKKIEAAGIKAYEQAWNRAKIEFLKLKYVRETIETVVNKRGLLVTLNDRVGNIDGTNVKAQGGELVSINGLIVETSEPIDFKSSATAFAIINDESGTPADAIEVTPRSDEINGFVLGSSLAFTPVFRGDNDYQIASLYNFFVDSDDQTAKDYTIQEIRPRDDGYVSLLASNYAVEIFSPDSEIPTPEA